LTPAMLNGLLTDALDGGTITSVEAHDIGEGTGIFGQIARLDLLTRTPKVLPDIPRWLR